MYIVFTLVYIGSYGQWTKGVLAPVIDGQNYKEILRNVESEHLTDLEYEFVFFSDKEKALDYIQSCCGDWEDLT